MKTKLTDIIIIIQCLNEVFENGSTFPWWREAVSKEYSCYITFFFYYFLFVCVSDYVCPHNEATCPHKYVVFLSSWDYTCLITCTRCMRAHEVSVTATDHSDRRIPVPTLQL